MDLKKLLINRLRSFNQIFLLLLALSLVSLSIADDAPSINDKIYTKKQAKTGETLYKNNCLICHNKKYFRPVFKTWENQSLGTFFLVMSSSMPENNPGSLVHQEYIDILAYILSLNRYSSGKEELSNSVDDLNLITIQPRKK
ncbi:hypothetical protein N9X63_05520 [Woeseiaceae bacterium]|nr:hypothetical protein [Woeseiaceae bacterium]